MSSSKIVGPLSGQRVVVIGGTSGMGLGAARAALAAGAEVIVASRRAIVAPSARDPQADSFQQAQVDITDEASVRHLFEGIERFDHLLITATPSAGDKPFLQQDLLAAQAIMNGKFFGSWACARHSAPKMRENGSITFVTGGAAVRPRPGITTLTAAFAALEALSSALALELGPLRVNTIRPGLIDSEMWNFLDPSAREDLRRKTRETFPVRRIGTIEDIGHAALFLMTNAYVTGTVLEVSGGETLVSL